MIHIFEPIQSKTADLLILRLREKEGRILVVPYRPLAKNDRFDASIESIVENVESIV